MVSSNRPAQLQPKVSTPPFAVLSIRVLYNKQIPQSHRGRYINAFGGILHFKFIKSKIRRSILALNYSFILIIIDLVILVREIIK